MLRSSLGLSGPTTHNNEKIRVLRAERLMRSCRKGEANVIPDSFRSNAQFRLKDQDKDFK